MSGGRLPGHVADALDAGLRADDELRATRYPGLGRARQPVHTAYVPADRFHADTPAEWGAAALAALDRHGPLPTAGPAWSASGSGVDAVVGRVRAKLAREPVEDLRVDLEDGYGSRPDAVEDADARAAGAALGAAVRARTAPPFCGLRVKSLEPSTRRRSLRTLDLFLEALLGGGAGLPPGFRVTLPKVGSVDQVTGFAEVCAALEQAYGPASVALRVELQVELPQAVLGADGTAVVARMLHALGGRCAGLHYGTYDYSAALGIAAPWQSLEHPAADHAKAVMALAAAGTGVPVSDGSTNVLPVGDTAAVRAAWALHARLVRRGLERGLYQGWDLHPAQLPSRYAATFAFYREALPVVAGRLADYASLLRGTGRQTGVADEPATAQSLAGYLLRGVDAGAVDTAEVESTTGLASDDLERLAARLPLA